VQNLSPIGRGAQRLRGEKKKERNHSKTEVLPKTIVFRRTNNVPEKYMVTSKLLDASSFI